MILKLIDWIHGIDINVSKVNDISKNTGLLLILLLHLCTFKMPIY